MYSLELKGASTHAKSLMLAELNLKVMSNTPYQPPVLDAEPRCLRQADALS